MTEKPRIGADDPDIGRDVRAAYDKPEVDAAARLGSALGVVIVAVGIMACVCIVLGLVWVALRLLESL